MRNTVHVVGKFIKLYLRVFFGIEQLHGQENLFESILNATVSMRKHHVLRIFGCETGRNR